MAERYILRCQGSVVSASYRELLTLPFKQVPQGQLSPIQALWRSPAGEILVGSMPSYLFLCQGFKLTGEMAQSVKSLPREQKDPSSILKTYIRN